VPASETVLFVQELGRVDDAVELLDAREPDADDSAAS
jgi:hypothetical protein